MGYVPTPGWTVFTANIALSARCGFRASCFGFRRSKDAQQRNRRGPFDLCVAAKL